MKEIYDKNKNLLFVIILLTLMSTLIFRTSFIDKIMLFDNCIIKIINEIIGKNTSIILSILTDNLILCIPIIILGCIYYYDKKKEYFYTLLTTYAGAGIVVYIIKLIIARSRPIDSIINLPKTFSFPSGHTFTSLCFYIMLGLILREFVQDKYKKLCLGIFIFIPLFVGFSRIYLGVHYASDVIGGMLFSIPYILIMRNVFLKK